MVGVGLEKFNIVFFGSERVEEGSGLAFAHHSFLLFGDLGGSRLLLALLFLRGFYFAFVALFVQGHGVLVLGGLLVAFLSLLLLLLGAFVLLLLVLGVV